MAQTFDGSPETLHSTALCSYWRSWTLRQGLVGCLQGQLDVQAAITAARLEETYQMDEWGLVEGGHDIDIADMQVRIAGPAVFLRLLKDAQ